GNGAGSALVSQISGLGGASVVNRAINAQAGQTKRYVQAADFVMAFETTDTIFGLNTSSASMTTTTPNDIFGNVTTKNVATADNGNFVLLHQTALAGYAGHYTAVFDFTAAGAAAVLSIGLGQQNKLVQLPIGRHVLSIPFSVRSGQSNTTLGF